MTDSYPGQTGRPSDSRAAAATKDTAATAQDTAAAAKDAAVDVADSGKQAATEVAQTGKDAARDVAQQTKEHATDLLGKTRHQLTEQVEVQQSSIVDTLRTLGEQLASMTENTDEHGTAVDVAARARDRARSAAEWLDERDPDQVLDELRRVGRERPGAFLLGAALAGVVAGRLTRGVVAVHTDDSASTRTPQVDAGHPQPFLTATTDPRPAPGRHEAEAVPGSVTRSDSTGLYRPGNGIAP